MGAEHYLSTHLKVAKKIGATNHHLLLTILMGSMIAETNALAQSLRVYEEFKDYISINRIKFGFIKVILERLEHNPYFHIPRITSSGMYICKFPYTPTS
jgi:hypothetical protein